MTKYIAIMNNNTYLGSLEFEYWAENVVDYSTLMRLFAAGLLGVGLCMMVVVGLCYKQGIEEALVPVKANIWKLRGKSKEYIQKFAKEVLPFVLVRE